MFNTLGSFSAVYFTLAAVLFILILFEKYFIKIEDNIRAKKKAVKKSVKANTAKKTVRKPDTNASLRNSNIRTAPVRRIPNNAA